MIVNYVTIYKLLIVVELYIPRFDSIIIFAYEYWDNIISNNIRLNV